ncbi:MAG: endonuclease domain-containing protein, partial [Burkholderia gladioli]
MNELALFAGAMKTHWKSSEYAREKAKAWRIANPDRVKDYRKKNRRSIYLTESARKYGITGEQFSEMMADQGEACATCRRPFDWGSKQTKPHIDHCHASKKIRGILCN